MPLTAQDHEDIRQLLARYNFAIDFGDVSDWVGTFTTDGIFECLGLPAGAPLGGRHAGTDQLSKYAVKHFETNKGRARHWNWNLVIDGTHDEAEMKCYLNAYSAGQGASAEFRETGIYRDKLLKMPDGWRFKERQVTIDPA